MKSCVFCRIATGEEKAWIIMEDEMHLAFLTPFPNTPGFTVVITKHHQPSYVFDLDDATMTKLFRFSKTVARLLDRKLGTRRTAMITEGLGVDHVHTKLIPLHGLPVGGWKPIKSIYRKTFVTYPGYVSSHDGPRAPEAELAALARRICDLSDAPSEDSRT